MRQLLYFLPLLLLLMPAAPVAAQECTTDPCPATADCTDCDDGIHIIDPADCHKFFICSGGVPTPPLSLDCDDGEFFNASSHECQEGTECEECGSGGGSCAAYECPPAGARSISSATDCSTYYECNATTGEVSGTVTCDDPDKPFFNGVECQDDETACCSCKPYCYTGDKGKLVADPLDCRKYHYCEEAPGSETMPGTCGDGLNFDPVGQTCLATAQCNPACTNVVGSDGCIDPFTCETEGYFAACPAKCTPDYYHCTSATGEYQDVQSCSTGVFHPDDHTCVDRDDCPYEE